MSLRRSVLLLVAPVALVILSSAGAATARGPKSTDLAVSISGSAAQGQTLKASVSSQSGSWTSYAYTWEDCDAAGASCARIAGAGASTYLLVAADVGRTIRVVVTASNKKTSSTAVSAPTAVVQAADTTPPSVPQGQTLSTTASSILMSWQPSTDNIGVAGYDVYLNGSKVAGTTSTSYTYSGLSCGTTYTVALDAYDAAGNHSDPAYASGSTSTGACSSTPSGTSSGTTSTSDSGLANLWVNTSAGASSSRSSTPVAFDASHAYGSFQAAFDACQPGDVIGVAAGSYGTQPLMGAKPAPGCAFDLDASGTQASVNPSFDSGGACRTPCVAGAEFRDGSFSPGWNITNPGNGVPTRVTFQNITSLGEEFFKGGSYVSVIGGSIGGYATNCEPAAMHIEGDGSSGVTQTNFLVRGVTFHDITNPLCNGATNHFELIRIDQNASFVTVEADKFVNNEQSSSVIFITDTSRSCSPSECPHDLTIENNFVAVARSGANGLFVNGNVNVAYCKNFAIRYNSLGVTTVAAGNMCTSSANRSNLSITGNIGPRDGACASGWSYDHNVWQWNSNTPCGSTDKIVIGSNYNVDQLGFASPSASVGDMHLTAASPGLHGGNPTDYPGVDYDGQARPITSGMQVDAGADEAS